MTDLLKPVSRKTRGAYPVLFRAPRQIVATLLPGDLIEFREAGRRQRWTVPIDAAFRWAVRCKALTDAAEKRARKKSARG